MRYSVQELFKVCSSLTLVLLLWIAACNYSGISSDLLPSPIQVWKAFKDYFNSGDLSGDLFSSFRRAYLGLLTGGALGLLTGVITGRIKLFQWLLSPIFNGLRALPPVAMVPLVVVWIGLGESSKIFITSWAAFFPVWLNTHDGVASVDKGIIWVAKSLGAKNYRLLINVIVPASIPRILVGFRLAISSTLICVIVAERTGAFEGLGFRLETAYLVFRVDRMITCMVLLAVIGVIVDKIFTALSSWVFSWIKLRHDIQ